LFLGVFTLFYYARKNQNDKKILGQKLYIYLLLRVIKLFYYEKKYTHTNLSLNNSIISNRSPEENVITSNSSFVNFFKR
jgi:hypothetical protein